MFRTFLSNSDRFTYTLRMAGVVFACRMWFQGARGFAQYAITKRLSHDSHPLYSSQTLPYYGGVLAQTLYTHTQNTTSQYTTVTTSTCDSSNSSQIRKFQLDVLNKVLFKLIERSGSKTLRDTDLQEGLLHMLSLLFETTHLNLPSLDCHFRYLFNI